jgi:hypothetical protein
MPVSRLQQSRAMSLSQSDSWIQHELDLAMKNAQKNRTIQIEKTNQKIEPAKSSSIEEMEAESIEQLSGDRIQKDFDHNYIKDSVNNIIMNWDAALHNILKSGTSFDKAWTGETLVLL